MFEKKKKKNGEQSSWSTTLLVVILVAGQVLLPITIIGLSAMWLFARSQAVSVPVYPAPPERIPLLIKAQVVDADGQPVKYREMRLNDRANTGEGGGSISKPTGMTNTDGMGSYLASKGVSTGCVWGSLEIDGYPRYEFEYGAAHIEWGASVDISFTVAKNGIASAAIIAPSDIKPALAPAPVMYLSCEKGTR